MGTMDVLPGWFPAGPPEQLMLLATVLVVWLVGRAARQALQGADPPG